MRDRTFHILALFVGVAVALSIAIGTIGIQPTVDHCPQSDEYVCPSPGLSNLIPAGIGSFVGALIVVGMHHFRARVIE